MKSRTQDFLEKLQAAKARDSHSRFVGFARAFCTNSLCAGREVDVKLDCIAGTPTTIACPLCGREPVVNRVETLSEYYEKNKSINRRSHSNGNRNHF